MIRRPSVPRTHVNILVATTLEMAQAGQVRLPAGEPFSTLMAAYADANSA